MQISNIFYDIKIPCILAVIGGCFLLYSLFEISSTRKVSVKKRIKQRNKIKNYIISIVNYSEKFEVVSKALDVIQFKYGYFSIKSEKDNEEYSKLILFKIVFFNIFLVLIITLFYNLLVAIACLIISTSLEYIFISSLVKKRQNKLKDEFHILVREFIEGYTITKNVRTSFERSLKGLSPIYKVHVTRLVNQLNSISNFEEAFDVFEMRINYNLCSCFFSIIRTAFKSNKNIIENLLELQNIIEEERTWKKKENQTLQLDFNVTIIWIAVAIVEFFLLGKYFATDTGNYYITTSSGQILLIVSIFSIVLAVICKKLVDSI